MTTEVTQERGRDCAPKIPPRTVNFDHLSDAKKMAVWNIYQETPAGLRQRLIDLQGVRL